MPSQPLLGYRPQRLGGCLQKVPNLFVSSKPLLPPCLPSIMHRKCGIMRAHTAVNPLPSLPRKLTLKSFGLRPFLLQPCGWLAGISFLVGNCELKNLMLPESKICVWDRATFTYLTGSQGIVQIAPINHDPHTWGHVSLEHSSPKTRWHSLFR